MLESMLIWMYFQSNSMPRAPTQRGMQLRKAKGGILQYPDTLSTQNLSEPPPPPAPPGTQVSFLRSLGSRLLHTPGHNELGGGPAQGSNHDLVFPLACIPGHDKV